MINKNYCRTQSLVKIKVSKIQKKYSEILNQTSATKKIVREEMIPSILNQNCFSFEDKFLVSTKHKKSSSFCQDIILKSSSDNMKCKANLFYSKLIDSLNSNESTTKDFTTEYDIYYKFFNEIASFLKPFDRVLKCVFNGMQKY